MCGWRFSEDLCWAIICAEYHGLNLITMSALTGVSEQQIQQIHDCYSWTGDVRTVHDQWGTETQGRNTKLAMEHWHVRWSYSTYCGDLLTACI